MRFEHEGHKYEEVRTIPRGYDIWNIGDHAPPGYIPLCRLKAIQPFEGCREIEPDTLKAIKTEGAKIIMQAAGRLTKDTPETWRRYIKRYENSRSACTQERIKRMRRALPYLEKLKFE